MLKFSDLQETVEIEQTKSRTLIPSATAFTEPTRKRTKLMCFFFLPIRAWFKNHIRIASDKGSKKKGITEKI